jgi:uncharacterized protein (DUF427 family)
MGLAWQQGPLATGAVGRFLIPDPLPERLLFAEPLRRRMRIQQGGAWIADSEDVMLLHEPDRYPVAYFPIGAIQLDALETTDRTTRHRDLGPTSWYTVRVGGRSTPRAAWQHTELPRYASSLEGRVAFAWRAMDAFYEEAERIVGHAADAYHRIDIRQTDRRLSVLCDGRELARSDRPLVLYESGFAPRWYVPRDDVDASTLARADGQTFCPYKGLASYYDVAGVPKAAWSYEDAWSEVRRISGLVSFEPDKVEVHLDGVRLRLAPGQSVVAHGIDRNLATDEAPNVEKT